MLAAINTTNLLLRPFEATDLAALYAFMSNPSAMQHTYVAPNIGHCAARLHKYESMRSTLGFAPWVALAGEEKEPIGWGGLSIDPEEPEWGLEVGYAFSPTAWGKGFATELVRASLVHAFGPLRTNEVHAYAKPENAASIRVLSKCGFQQLRYEPRIQRNHYIVHAPSAA